MKKEKNNEKLISIIIPLYNTNPEIFKRCIISIEKQDYKNIEIIIVDDCSNESYNSLIKYYKQSLNINYIKLEHNYGPGVARKIGLNNANGDYVTFVDSDDELYDNTSILKLINEINLNPKLDMVAGLANEELSDGSFKKRERNFIWVFGKLFRRNFFIENNFTFNETRENEDNGFTTLFRLLTDNYKFIDEVVYIWRYEPNSITRRNGHEYYFTSIEGYVNNMIWVYNECKKRNLDNCKKQRSHFINVWIRLYFYAIEVLFDRNAYDANLLSIWCNNYYESVYKYINANLDEFMECWKIMVGGSPETFFNRIINISYPEFCSIISSNNRFIEEE